MTCRIGITGGSGYIGSSLAKHFLKSSFSVKLLDICKSNTLSNRKISFQRCDIRNYQDVRNAFYDVDVVIHTSIVQIPKISEQKRLAYEVNILGTENVCRAAEECIRVKGLILSGSWHTMGERKLRGIVDEEFGFRPDKVEDRARLYALSKIGQETIEDSTMRCRRKPTALSEWAQY